MTVQYLSLSRIIRLEINPVKDLAPADRAELLYSMMEYYNIVEVLVQAKQLEAIKLIENCVNGKE